MAHLRIGTRGSQLALWQANAVAALLRDKAHTACEVVVIKTTGDRLAEAKLSQIGGKRLFVKEIEDALLAGEVDLAVHSSKDMPAVLPEGLTIAAVLPREDARDAIVLPQPAGPRGAASENGASGNAGAFQAIVERLGRTPHIGTSSVRRVAQLTRLFPGARFGPIRGNLDTRLRKLDSGDFDAIVLASAGLRRLGQGNRISAALPIDACVPAPGQGIVAVEIRDGDSTTASLLASINDAQAAIALEAERAVVRKLGGGCQMPIGAFAEIGGGDPRSGPAGSISVRAIVVSTDGARAAHAEVIGSADEADAAGEAAAEQLLERGADTILAEVQRQQAAVEGLQP
ncbi:MAG TPA: hydroxymethylbilane synthase [Vicinamibacterales bacterium]|nr:hydroxymethylbilane synthase [Vicinamibacterales bacterium]